MRVLLDECAPKQLKYFLLSQGHGCATAQEEGWSGITNGELLALAEPKFDVLVTIDKGVRHQQNLTGRNIAIVVVRGRSNRLVHLRPHFEACAEAVRAIRPARLSSWATFNGIQIYSSISAAARA